MKTRYRYKRSSLVRKLEGVFTQLASIDSMTLSPQVVSDRLADVEDWLKDIVDDILDEREPKHKEEGGPTCWAASMAQQLQKSQEMIHVLEVEVESESSDRYGPFFFEEKPNDKQLLKFLKEHTSPDDADETADGPGWNGTFLHLAWSQQPRPQQLRKSQKKRR